MSKQSVKRMDCISFALLGFILIAGVVLLSCFDDEALQASKKQPVQEELIKQEDAMTSIISQMENDQKSELSKNGISIIEIPLSRRDENEVVFTGKRKIR